MASHVESTRNFVFWISFTSEYNTEFPSIRTTSALGICGPEQERQETGTATESARTPAREIDAYHCQDKGAPQTQVSENEALSSNHNESFH